MQGNFTTRWIQINLKIGSKNRKLFNNLNNFNLQNKSLQNAMFLWYIRHYFDDSFSEKKNRAAMALVETKISLQDLTSIRNPKGQNP